MDQQERGSMMNKNETLEDILETNEKLHAVIGELRNNRQLIEKHVREYEKHKNADSLELLVNEINRSEIITHLHYNLIGQYVEELTNAKADSISK